MAAAVAPTVSIPRLPPNKLLFLPSKTPQNHKSKRQLQLEDQEARSHAASVAHSRGRSNHASIQTKTGSKLVQRESAGPEYASAIQHSQGLAWIKTGPLDPFLRLPGEMKMQERNMLFHYIDTAPRLFHGVKRNPVYCPVRECTIVSMSMSPLFVQWIVLMAEMNTGAPETAIYARRAGIYAEMRRAVQDPAEILSDTTLLHLACGALCEVRLGNVDIADKHYTALMKLLRMRKGLRTLQEIPIHLGLGVVHCFTVGAVPLFRTRLELQAALDRMTMPRGKPVDPRIQRYFQANNLASPHIWNLHALNMVMENEPGGFMDRFVHNIIGSEEKLTPLAMTFMIGQSALEVGEWFGPSPALRSWEALEFVRLVSFAVLSRDAIVRSLSSWVTDVDEKVDLDLDALKAEILDGWILAHGSGALLT